MVPYVVRLACLAMMHRIWRLDVIDVSAMETWVVPRPSGRVMVMVAVAAIVALPFLLVLPYLDRPLDGDEGIYAVIGRSLLHGGVPYEDLFDNKPPLLYGWYAAGFFVFGETVESTRLVAGLVMSATAFLVFVEGRLLFSTRAGLVGAAGFAISQFLVPHIANGFPETLMLLPMVGAFVALTKGMQTDGGRWFLVAGALAGAAIMTKPVAIWSVLAIGVGMAIWAWQTRETWRAQVAPLVQFAAGSLIFITATLAPFVITSSFDSFYTTNVTFNMDLGAAIPYADRLPRMISALHQFTTNTAPLVVAAAVGLGVMVWVARRERRPEHISLVLLALGAVAGVASPGFFFSHHFIQLLPVMALMVAGAFYGLPLLVANHRERVVMAVAVGGVMVGTVAVTQFWSPTNPRALAAPDASARAVPEEHRYEVSPQDLPSAWADANAAMGAYLQQHTSPSDTIYVNDGGGGRSPIYFHANRAPAVYLFYDTPLKLHSSNIADMLAELDRAQPAYIVDTFFWDFRYSWSAQVVTRTTEYYQLLADDYEYVDTFHFADVYRRSDHNVGVTATLVDRGGSEVE
jgi:hypothetical protein